MVARDPVAAGQDPAAVGRVRVAVALVVGVRGAVAPAVAPVADDRAGAVVERPRRSRRTTAKSRALKCRA